MNNFYITSLYNTAISKLFTRREEGRFIRDKTVEDFYNPDFRLEVALKLSTIGDTRDERKWGIEIALGTRLENLKDNNEALKIYDENQNDILNLYKKFGFDENKVKECLKK